PVARHRSERLPLLVPTAPRATMTRWMSSADRRPWLLPSLAGVLVLIFLIQCFTASSVKSPAWDETGDIAAGVSYLVTDSFIVNLQHPPLLKELIGLSTLLSGARWPNSPQAQQLLAGDPQYQWLVGNQIIIAGGADNVMFWARLSMILVGAMLAALLYVWGSRMLGGVAAVGAVFLCAFDPTVIAHAHLTTLDVGFAAFTILFLFALWSYLRYPTTKRLLLCGLALGALLATKFSALVLLPVTAVLVLAALWRPPAVSAKAPLGFANPYVTAPSAKVNANDPCPCGSGKKYKKCHGDPDRAGAPSGAAPARNITTAIIALAIMGVIAVVVVEAL